MAAVGALEDVPESKLRRVMETNFFGVLELTRALLPTFRAQRRGRIVIVSSEAAFMGQPTNSIYCASKWAVEGWAEAVAYELEPFGIDIILVEPGPYRTEIWDSTPRIQPPDSPYHAWVQHVLRAGDAHAEEWRAIRRRWHSESPMRSRPGRRGFAIRSVPSRASIIFSGASFPAACCGERQSSIWDFQKCVNDPFGSPSSER